MFIILVNSKGLADKIYYLPVTPEYVKQVIDKENPDGISLSFGGQTALNCGVKLYEQGHLKNIKILGSSLQTVSSYNQTTAGVYLDTYLGIGLQC